MVYPRRTVQRCLALTVALAPSVAAPAGASGATLGLDQRCYVSGEQAALSGSGFLSAANLTLTRGSDAITGVATDNSGAFRRQLLVPEIPDDTIETQIEVAASDGSSTARAYLNVTRTVATFDPTDGDLRTLRVRHLISGFGLSESSPSVYLHYVSPVAQLAAKKQSAAASRAAAGATLASVKTGGSTVAISEPPGVKTVRLGLLRGPCGVLRTSPRKLFPFQAQSGTWLLQYDTNARYVAGTSSSSFYWIARKVTIAD
ncbi:MAG: hypothetical protein QM679_08465 [Patulibacter sp.]